MLYLIIALTIAALLVSIVFATAADMKSKRSNSSTNMRSGAGPSPSATARSLGTRAFIYTDNPATSSPMETTGSVRLSVVDATPRAAADSMDRIDFNASFNYPANGPLYTVSVTEIVPQGRTSNWGGVALNQPLFGDTGIGMSSLPRTTAYIAAWGLADIKRDGKSIAEDQLAVVMVNHAIHSATGTLLSTADPSAEEITLILPGPMANECVVPGFPNGSAYVYWPSSAHEFRNMEGMEDQAGATITTPGGSRATVEVERREGAGPQPRARATEQQGRVPVMNISLTNRGIVKTIGTAEPGLYDVRVTNNSSTNRGLLMSGIDICCSPYNRFSDILRPGKSQTFRFFFAEGKVTMRDVMSARRTKTAFANVKFGPHTSSIVFGY